MAIFDLPEQSTITALGLYQGWWGDLVWGEGTDWIVAGRMDGILGYDSRISDAPIPQGHGEIPFGRWARGKSIIIPFLIGGDLSTHADRRNTWEAAFEASDPYEQEWLAFKILGRTLLARGRVIRKNVEVSDLVGRTVAAPATVEIRLADPRIYDGDEWVSTVFVPFGTAEGGGFNLPVAELPINMTAPTGGFASALNNGTANAYPLMRVSNPAGAGSAVTSISVTNETYQETVQIDATIAEGQTLVADFDALVRAAQGPHIHIDGASRFAFWQHPRIPLALRPGTNLMTATFTGGDPTVRLDWLHPTI